MSIRLLLVMAASVSPSTAPAPQNLIRRSLASDAPAHQASGLADLLRTLAALAIVLLAIWALRWLMKKFSARVPAGAGSTIRIISRTAISPRQNLVLLSVGERVLLIAQGAQQVNTLCEITDPHEVAALLNRPLPSAPRREDFAAALRRATSPPGDPEVGISTTQQELSGLIQKVRVLSQHFQPGQAR